MTAMAYRFRQREAVHLGVRRIVREQIDAALTALRAPPDEHVADAVHDVRTCCKKLRAVLQLLRAEIGKKVYRKEDNCFRKAAQKLSAMRDAHVAVESLNALIAHYSRELPPQPFGQARDVLAARSAEVQNEQLAQGSVRAEAARRLTQARQRVARWPIKSNEFALLRPGIEAAYRRGRMAFTTVYKMKEPEAFHDWRKHVKELWYALRLVKTAWNPVLDPLSRQVRFLSELLGDDHDLALLQDAIARERVLFGSPEEVAALLGLIERRRVELRRAARPLAKRIYGEKTPAFADRLELYWRAWRPKGQRKTKQTSRKRSKKAATALAPELAPPDAGQHGETTGHEPEPTTGDAPTEQPNLRIAEG